MRGVQSLPSLPSLPFKDWCEDHDAVEDFWDIEPICPYCKIKMKIRKTIPGDQWICDNYAYCGGREKLKSTNIQND